jgi:mRNA interferase HicA
MIFEMKYSEFHRKIVKNGWKFKSASGSHYFYEKDGKESPGIPFHGVKEMYDPLRKAIERQMGLK